jgi:Mg-chelatase subunit ChlD
MARRRSVVSGSIATFSLGCALLAACSSPKGETGFSSDNNITGSSGSSGGKGSSSGGSSGSSGNLFGDGGTSIAADAACATSAAKAQQQPLDMYVMLDQSGSMGQQGKWPSVTGALKSFFAQPTATGIGVGLQYFGLDNGGGSSCTASDYSSPEIEISALPGSATQLATSLDGHGPRSDTPTLPALQGAVDHAKAWASAHAGHVTIVVLATDGEPSSTCDDDLGHIDAIASAAAAGNPKILTFVIGVGSSLSNLNGIAAAGGTSKAFIVDPNGNTSTQFLDALNKIRGTALGCNYKIPVPGNGGTLDYGTVNVEYTPGGGGGPVTIPKVADKASCPGTGDAWYYDNNAQPTQILLCDSSCNKATADATAQVNIVIGCSTVLK